MTEKDKDIKTLQEFRKISEVPIVDTGRLYFGRKSTKTITSFHCIPYGRCMAMYKDKVVWIDRIHEGCASIELRKQFRNVKFPVTTGYMD